MFTPPKKIQQLPVNPALFNATVSSNQAMIRLLVTLVITDDPIKARNGQKSNKVQKTSATSTIAGGKKSLPSTHQQFLIPTPEDKLVKDLIGKIEKKHLSEMKEQIKCESVHIQLCDQQSPSAQTTSKTAKKQDNSQPASNSYSIDPRYKVQYCFKDFDKVIVNAIKVSSQPDLKVKETKKDSTKSKVEVNTPKTTAAQTKKRTTQQTQQSKSKSPAPKAEASDKKTDLSKNQKKRAQKQLEKQSQQKEALKVKQGVAKQQEKQKESKAKKSVTPAPKIDTKTTTKPVVKKTEEPVKKIEKQTEKVDEQKSMSKNAKRKLKRAEAEKQKAKDEKTKQKDLRVILQQSINGYSQEEASKSISLVSNNLSAQSSGSSSCRGFEPTSNANKPANLVSKLSLPAINALSGDDSSSFGSLNSL